MKAKIPLFAAVAFCCWLTTSLSVFAQGTLFTYQGVLSLSNSPVRGTYNMTFKLWNAGTGGAQVGGTITTNGVVIVTNGLYTVYLDFGNQYAAGTPYWLELGVETNGGGSFTTLAPRQQLTPIPYAITAENVDGSVPASQLTGTVPSGVLSGNYSNPLNLNNPGNIFDGNGAGLTGVNAATLNGYGYCSLPCYWNLTGNAGTTAGLNFIGTSDNQPLEVHVNGQRAFRVEPDASGFATPNVIGGAGNSVLSGTFGATIGGGGGSLGPNSVTNNFGTVAGGVANTSGQQAAIGGGYLNSASGLNAVVGGGYNNKNSGDEATIGGGFGNTVSGYVATVPGGYNNTAAGSYSFAAGYQAQAMNSGSFVWADAVGGPFSDTSPNQFLVRAGFVGINRATQVSGNEYFGIYAPVTNNWVGMYIQGSNTSRPFYGYANPYGGCWTENNGTQNNTWELFNSGYWLSVTTGGNVGIGTMTPASALEVANGNVQLDNHELFLTSNTDTNSGYGLGYRTGLPGISSDGPLLYGYNGGALAGLGPTTIALSWSWTGNVWVSNNLSTATLTIRGGADLAEPFNINSANGEVPQGAVVVIDDQNPGHLKLSESPYDTRVAGVVSGANGVNPGIQMHQQGLIEGGKNVALTGRVYVQADASNGAIRPGDMLTTSSTPGHAMKVSDHARAAGAILGKAMTGLSEGKGMVLVLVTLQ